MTEAACSGTRACHAISNTVITVVLAVLREHAVDGTLALADVERILGLIGRGTVALDEAYRAQEERCAREHSRPKGNVGARSNPFQRLMVRPFESLLAGERPVFPRALLPNYFAFLDHAMGPERDSVERDCRAIIAALLVVHGNHLTWDHFYGDLRTLTLLHRALRNVSLVLSTAEGERRWNSLLLRPLAGMAAPSIAQADLVRETLLETHRGLSAA